MTRFLIARHGETAWNHARRLQGQIDVELSDFGREQARRLGERLAAEEIAVAYSSDLKRCWETATIVLAGRDMPLYPEAGLREIHLGEWQGLTGEELRASRPEEVARVEADLDNLAPPGGETRREVQRRVVAAFAEIGAAHPDQTALVVSHGGALRSLLCWVLQTELRMGRRVDLDNCGLSVLELRGNVPLLVRWNGVDHLAGLVDPGTRDAAVE